MLHTENYTKVMRYTRRLSDKHRIYLDRKYLQFGIMVVSRDLGGKFLFLPQKWRETLPSLLLLQHIYICIQKLAHLLPEPALFGLLGARGR